MSTTNGALRSLLALLIFASSALGQANPACIGTTPSGRCSASTFSGILPQNASIEKVALVIAGCYGEGPSDLGQPNYAYNLPQLCAVTVRVSSYRFGLFLPTASTWNGRFLAVGNYAFLGGINWVDMTPGPQYGMATISTDTGHNSGAADISWSAGNPTAQTDWGYASLNGSIHYGKLFTERYYNKKISYSYYTGCSTGGRQGIKQVQVDTASIDGALVGAAAWHENHLMPWYTKLGSVNLPENDPKNIYAKEWGILTGLALRQCDSLDGVTDNIISNDNCTIPDSAFLTIQCGQPGVDPNNCLTAAQVETSKKAYSDYVINGTLVYNGPIPGSESDFASSLTAGLPSGFDQQWEKYMLYNDPNWTYQNFSDQVFFDSVRINPGNATADHFDISAFRDRGGKILMYHGVADGLVPTKGSTLYYTSTRDTLNDQQLQKWFRLFQVPGMHHCWGTDTSVNAPWYFAAAGQPAQLYPLDTTGYSTPGHRGDKKFDALLALVDWVEKGSAVDSIIATAYNSGSLTVNRTRPLCPWPKKAVWNGTGDQNAAASWACQ
ncbi:tannase and feruloyl esterase [Thozetella sp. PMI_491]|nr:tannase and feruloyl esterase [Thozetella sp. PMI_491]